MALDLAKTLDVVKLGLTDPAAAWQKYFAEERDWQDTAMLLTGPLILLYVVLVPAFTTTFSRFGGLIPGGFWGMLISTLVSTCVGLFVGAFVFSFLADKLGGKSSFNNAFAAISLAWVPAVLGGILGAILPFIGALLALAAAVLSLVYLYRLLHVALELPDSKRLLHIILGIVVIVIINIVVASVLGLGSRGAEPYQVGAPYSESSSGDTTRASGMVGAMQRYGEIMNTAGTHEYTPPGDGKLTKAQIENYVDVQRKARNVQARLQKKIQDMEKSMENQEQSGLSGLSALGSTIGTAMGAQNAEMEIVVTGNGNWAEYNWVKGQIQTAMLHGGEGDAAISHNYKMIQPYMEDL